MKPGIFKYSFSVGSLVFLLGLCFGNLYGQISAPSLRCLEVLNNGDVKLTWVTPADPNTVFVSYEIFTATINTGPFVPTATIMSLATNTFVHAGAGANTRSVYYFIRCNYGPGNNTIHSDTLQSIFLNILTSSGGQDIKLKYNPLREPALISASPNFTIHKEFPKSSWNTFTTTPLLGFPDTISVCSASLNYQVSLSDNSGCISRSNIQGGLYNDTKQPNQPVIDSISVLPNGQTIIAWKIPFDKDITTYEIQYLKGPGQRDILDKVNGRLNTSYIFTSTLALSGPQELYVGAKDSCNKLSTINYQVSSMFLKTKYNRCAYSTELSWNAYPSMINEVKEYRVYYSVNGGAYTQIGTTTLTSFVHANADAGNTLSYFIRVINKTLDITASSNRVAFSAAQVNSPAFIYIKQTSVVSRQAIALTVLVDTSAACTGIDVWRSEDGVNFTQITSIAGQKQLYYSYTDENAQTTERAYYYRVALRDSCGNPRSQSNICRSIHLRVSENRNELFERTLHWSDYIGFNAGVKSFLVYRVINDVVPQTPVATVNSGTFSYTDNLESEAGQGARVYYLIKAVENPGNIYGVTGESGSNPASVYPEDAIFIPNAFSPGGLNKIWMPVTVFVDIQEYYLRVFDRWGKQVFLSQSPLEGWDGGLVPQDIYVYLLQYKNSRGEYKEKKGTVLLIR